MLKKIAAIILSLTLLISVTGCNKTTRYSAEFLILFDTMTQVVAYSKNEDDFNKFSGFIYDHLEEYHQLYDIYNSYDGVNNIKTINQNAGIAPVKVDKKIIDLLLYSKELYKLSDGKFNVALGSVLRIWHDYREVGIDDPENAQLPPMEKLQNANLHTDINKVVIDEAASTVYLTDPEMSLDVGGIAKGYATEQVCKEAEEHGYTSALLSVGGNVRAIGTKNSDPESLWSVGIQNPNMDSEQTTVQTLLIGDGYSVTTSGDYQRFYTVDGINYHHIIDPDTLMPNHYFKAVTIVCKGIGDGLSNMVFNMPYEQGLALIESLPDTEAMWFFADGSMKYTEGYGKLIKQK